MSFRAMRAIKSSAANKMIWVLVFMVGFPLLTILGGPAFASDPPHWTGAKATVLDCVTPCHVTHDDLGGSLTSASSNVNLCVACHNPSGQASGLPVNKAESASPGEWGTSHAFDVAAVHAGYATQRPNNTDMDRRVMDGSIVCSTCHDQHKTESTNRGTPRISPPEKFNPASGTGALTSGGVFSGVEGTWFHIKITIAGNQSGAQFQHRKYTESGGWTAWSADTSAGTDVPIVDGVTVTFGSGTYELDEEWQFYASFPFLRAPLDLGDNASGDRFCRDCHGSWMMDHTTNPGQVNNYDGNYKSHPVGVALDANGGGYDRVGAILDGNGALQSTGDGNASNDLLLDSGGLVQCLSCHDVHGADSNTITDQP